jgi:ribosomal protein L24
MTQSEAEAMIGKEVRVVAGPFKGSTGKLVRKNKQYYFLKAVIGMGVMVRVSRWYS